MIFYILITTIVFLIGGVIAFQIMNREVQNEQKWYLGERMPSIIKYLERRQPENNVIRDKMIIMPLLDSVPELNPVYSDTMVMHTTLQRMEPHMKLEAVKNIKGRSYRIILYDLVVESDDIEDVVQESMIKIFALLLVLTLILGSIGSYFVFRPFRNTLLAIRGFSLKSLNPIVLPKSSTTEFKRLNKFILEMTEKVQRDYLSLKEFSENASHEMQTPLAIAQGKLEILLGDEKLSEEQLELINSAQDAIKRVSKLGRSLSLLTKIENKEFSDFKAINISKLLDQQLYDFNELIGLKSLKLETKITNDVFVRGNQVLFEILITNLLNNSIRHNIKRGFINIVLSSKEFIIENSGKPLKGKAVDYFERFKKDNADPGSSGLGLSIIKTICDEMDLEIQYENHGERHKTTLRF